MERLRGVADANRDLARSQSLQTGQALDALRARQAPVPPTPPVRATVPPDAAPAPPADTRQIDAWLDRRPN